MSVLALLKLSMKKDLTIKEYLDLADSFKSESVKQTAGFKVYTGQIRKEWADLSKAVKFAGFDTDKLFSMMRVWLYK